MSAPSGQRAVTRNNTNKPKKTTELITRAGTAAVLVVVGLFVPAFLGADLVLFDFLALAEVAAFSA